MKWTFDDFSILDGGRQVMLKPLGVRVGDWQTFAAMVTKRLNGYELIAADMAKAHDRRVSGLLEANSREVTIRRDLQTKLRRVQRILFGDL